MFRSGRKTGKKPLRVRVKRFGEQIVNVRGFDDVASIHHGNPISHLAGDREVVSNE